MSEWVKCEVCGALKEIPAYEGDGVYSRHVCEVRDQSRMEHDNALAEIPKPWDGKG